MANLTQGALGRIQSGADVSEPLVQVLGHKPIQSAGQERFRMLLSDGLYSNSFSMLATQMNHMIHEKKLEPFTIVKLKKHICNSVAGNKKVLIVMDLEVVKPGAEVGYKIGNPVTLPSDGSAPPPPVQNQNKDPNLGAVKRPADQNAAAPPEKIPATNRSILQSRPSIGSTGLGQSAGSTAITPIVGITPYQNKWTIKARVTSKSDIRTWNKASGSGKLFSMDLMDESGEIRATAFKDQCDQYYDYIQVGKVYLISRCAVKAANKAYSKLKNDYELTFKDNVLVELVEGEDTSDVPTVSYNFVSISDLSAAEKDTIVDVIGICKAANDPVSITTKAGKELTKREISLVDQTTTEVTLTLWGSVAETFNTSGNSVVAVKGARVSDFSGVTLSGGDILVNPELPQTNALLGWWEEKGKRTTVFNSLTVQGQRGGAAGGMDAKSLKSFSDVKIENIGYNSDRGDYYSVVAYVTFFSKEKSLYKACPNQVDGRECNKKVNENGDGTYRCEKCAQDLDNFKWRLMLSLSLADYSDTIWATCFQETAEKILEKSSEEVGKLYEQDEERFNAVFSQACFKAYAFRMRAKSDTYNDETRVKHTIVGVDAIQHEDFCRRLVKEIESLGGYVPESVDRDLYV